MKKFFRFLFDTAWGPAVALAVAAAIVLGVWELLGLPSFSRWCDAHPPVVPLLFLPTVLCAFAVPVAIVRSLFLKSPGRAVWQAVLSAAVYTVFFAILPPPWCTAPADGSLPFDLQIRFSPVGPLSGGMNGYEKRIVFPSGNRVGLERRHVGYGATAAYALPDGAFLLVDGMPAGLDRRFFRIDPAAGTVELLAGAGDSAGRRFLGLVLPEGTFDSDAPDPLATEGGAE